MSSDHPLDLDGERLRALVDGAMERLVPFVDGIAEAPMGQGGDAALARSLAEPLPEDGTAYDDLLDLLFETALPGALNTTSAGYLAYVPGGGLLPSAVADLLANVTNRYVGAWYPSPGLVQLEVNVVRWFCEMVGYPAAAGGFLTPGGSMANLTAITTARHEKLGEDFLDGTVYVSDQIHHSVLKAASLAGIRARHVRRLPSDERFRLDVGALEEHVAADRAAGRKPFLVVASGGTTNSGAVDDLEAIADVARREDLWMHVDAAYGGFFVLTERGRRALAGLERADSVTLDPHKGLFLPYGTGALLARDAGSLRRTHTVHADYMPPMQTEDDLVDFCEISPELSRDFRGLRVWLPLKLHGVGAFRRTLDEKLDLARFAADALREVPGLRIVAEPELSILAFVLDRPGLDDAELDALNRELLARINARQRVYLTATRLKVPGAAGGPPADRFAIRICVLAFRTHRDRMEACLEDVRAAVGEV